MRVAALYDIHGNLPALEAVLKEVEAETPDAIVIGGDVVPGPMPMECLERLLALNTPVHFIRGNGDREVLAFQRGEESSAIPENFREGMRWNARRLSDDHARALKSWPATFSMEITDLGKVLFCHATPGNDVDVFTRLTPEERLLPIFENVKAGAVVCGHTHMPFDRRIGGVRVINPGSVGMPFGRPGAYWCLLGRKITFRHTLYDFEAAAEQIRHTDYAGADAFAEKNVLNPPTEEQMLRAFSAIELMSRRDDVKSATIAARN